MHDFFGKQKLLCSIVTMAVIASSLALVRNYSHEDIVDKLQRTGAQIRPILGGELKVKREYFASHTSFVFETLAKVIASPTLKTETYKQIFSGASVDEATRAAVNKMPPEEIGMVIEVDGVPVEFTRFRFEHIPKTIAAMQSELLKKDFINAQCDKPEYAKRMTCSKIAYIPKRNFLLTVSDIKRLIEVKDINGKLIARDYEAIPDEGFQNVIRQLQQL